MVRTLKFEDDSGWISCLRMYDVYQGTKDSYVEREVEAWDHCTRVHKKVCKQYDMKKFCATARLG